MLLFSAAFASSPPSLEVYAWPTEAAGAAQLVIALTTDELKSGRTYLVDVRAPDTHVELACTREQLGGVVCVLDGKTFRTDWGDTTHTDGFDLFAGVRADPSPAETKRVMRKKRSRNLPDPDEELVVRPVEAIVAGLPLTALGSPGETTVEARVVRRSWRPEVVR